MEYFADVMMEYNYNLEQLEKIRIEEGLGLPVWCGEGENERHRECRFYLHAAEAKWRTCEDFGAKEKLVLAWIRIHYDPTFRLNKWF